MSWPRKAGKPLSVPNRLGTSGTPVLRAGVIGPKPTVGGCAVTPPLKPYVGGGTSIGALAKPAIGNWGDPKPGTPAPIGTLPNGNGVCGNPSPTEGIPVQIGAPDTDP